MNHTRRRVLGLGTGFAAWAFAAAAGLVRPGTVYAASSRTGFEAKTASDALKQLGATQLTTSRDIVINAPDVAENGAAVPVTITSRIPNTQSISIIAEKNPQPLAATFDIANGLEPYASLRIKLSQSSDVRAVVKAGGRYYTAVKEVKVTVGGCG